MSSQEYILELAMQISKTHKRIIACNRIYAEAAWPALVCTNMCHPLHGIFKKIFVMVNIFPVPDGHSGSLHHCHVPLRSHMAAKDVSR